LFTHKSNVKVEHLGLLRQLLTRFCGVVRNKVNLFVHLNEPIDDFVRIIEHIILSPQHTYRLRAILLTTCHFKFKSLCEHTKINIFIFKEVKIVCATAEVLNLNELRGNRE
jgi:hypothetical protein